MNPVSIEPTIAIVGASNNPEKYGHKVMANLLGRGYKVIPINPKEEIIQGEKVYKTLTEYNQEIDIAVFVVPPQVTEKVLEDAHAIGVSNVWLQPGSESDKAVQYCRDNSIKVVYNKCIMLASDPISFEQYIV